MRWFCLNLVNIVFEMEKNLKGTEKEIKRICSIHLVTSLLENDTINSPSIGCTAFAVYVSSLSSDFKLRIH